MTAPRICNREGCERHVFARSKCVSHYNSMLKSLRRKGSTLFAAVDTWTEVQKHLPGTLYELSARSGITYNAVRRVIKNRQAAGDLHICRQRPPGKVGGGRWVSVFALGACVDNLASPKRKKNHMLKGRREAHAARRAAEKVSAAPAFATTWNRAFFDPARAFV